MDSSRERELKEYKTVKMAYYFASEIGYHGCNAAESLQKFISSDSLLQMGMSI